MRIITVDNGNTNPHVGIFQNEKLESVITSPVTKSILLHLKTLIEIKKTHSLE